MIDNVSIRIKDRNIWRLNNKLFSKQSLCINCSGAETV